MKILFLTLLFLGCQEQSSKNASQESSIWRDKSQESCVCMEIYAPVCVKGKTYSNSCVAHCEGHSEWTEGQCP